MRQRLGHHLLTACAAISLLLCIAVGMLWWTGGYSLVQGRYNRSPQPDDSYAYYVAAQSFSGTLTFEFSHRHFEPLYLRGLNAEEMHNFRLEYPTGWRW